MNPTPLCCPNCGGGLGRLQDGQYLCAYCGHRSTPPRPVLDQAEQDRLVADAVGRHEAARMERARVAVDAESQRERDDMARNKRTLGTAFTIMGALFLAGGLACWSAAIIDADATSLAERQGVPYWLGFGLFWVALGGGFFYGGLRILRTGRREARLRMKGLHGRAIITSYGAVKYVGGLVTFDDSYDLVLRVEIVGRAPYTIKTRETVELQSLVATDAELPVLVDPINASDVMIDWETAAVL